MPIKPRHICFFSGCNELTAETYCSKHMKAKLDQRKQYDKNRPEYHKLYKSARWQNLRKQVLLINPLCVECKNANRFIPATIVDHVVPHKGDEKLFWIYSNLQPLCKSCHDRKTSKEESWNTIQKN